ncbi:Histidine kinase [Sulfitobacter noctilucae]|uniref:sensor histidine kinase n=1 Tax=Sulfitobacter noctilucae TaxID=1342302 RepID=UPI0004689F92|nr:ATP-binding protein [Sulfitobacter noctilucae]KIN70787.1 Histidine kinase [Sulfitobacter noctilucae]
MTPELEQTDPVPPASGGTSKDIDDFIYLISHDVRASVRALLELPQWIAEDLEESGFKIEGPVATSIEMMNRHTGRLDRMLVDLLTFSRVGRMQTVREVNFNEALDQVLEAMILPTGFKVARALECENVIMGDRDVLTLFDALLQNAVKHHDRTEGHISVTSTFIDGAVALTVADDGPGILPEYHERVFGPMTTLRPRDEVEGSGMGLANVRRIATHYGGTARLISTPDTRGCQVEVRLPL